MTARSSLYRGRVRHTRLRPFNHSFEYRVYYLMVDIDDLVGLDDRLRLFSIGRPTLFSLDTRLHGPGDGSPLRPWAERVLADAGIDLDGGRILLLTLPRILGYVFNPISVWYCYGAGDTLEAMIYEVRNTFGDRHIYVTRFEDGRTQQASKALHVSPFNDMNQSYRFVPLDPGERLTLSIEQSDGQGIMFRAGMRLTRLELTDLNLMRLFITHPLLTLKVIGAIHWEALRIWLKGGTYHARPSPPSNTITVINTEKANQ